PFSFFFLFFLLLVSTLFPYTTLFRSCLMLDGLLPQQERMWSRFTTRLMDATGTAAPALALMMSKDHLRPMSSVSDSRMDTSLKRSEEHTSELQSRFDLVCSLLLEKKK